MKYKNEVKFNSIKIEKIIRNKKINLCKLIINFTKDQTEENKKIVEEEIKNLKKYIKAGELIMKFIINKNNDCCLENNDDWRLKNIIYDIKHLCNVWNMRFN